MSRLHRRPQEYEFYQAVRLLERMRVRTQGRSPVASDTPETDAVRFRAVAGLGYPGRPIDHVAGGSDADDPATVGITFPGLIGAGGVLPEHYTELVLRRRRARDRSLADFLDILHTRLTGLLYRAWAKYRPAVAAERASLTGDPDAITTALRALVGLGSDAMADRTPGNGRDWVYFGGHFGRSVRSAAALEQVLGDVVRAPVRVESFAGRWRTLPVDDQTALASPTRPHGQHARLGESAMLGERSWDITGQVRIWVGPVSLDTYTSLLPGRPGARRLAELADAFTGVTMESELQLILNGRERPSWTLATDPASGRRLGWNTWLASGPSDTDVIGARFDLGERECRST